MEKVTNIDSGIKISDISTGNIEYCAENDSSTERVKNNSDLLQSTDTNCAIHVNENVVVAQHCNYIEESNEQTESVPVVKEPPLLATISASNSKESDNSECVVEKDISGNDSKSHEVISPSPKTRLSSRKDNSLPKVQSFNEVQNLEPVSATSKTKKSQKRSSIGKLDLSTSSDSGFHTVETGSKSDLDASTIQANEKTTPLLTKRRKRKTNAVKEIIDSEVCDSESSTVVATPQVEPVVKKRKVTPGKGLKMAVRVVSSTQFDNVQEDDVVPELDSSENMSRLRRTREDRRRSQRETKSPPPTPISTGRPKRNAARAADSKIKSLVNNSLEAVCLDEVDQPITQQCANCKRMKLCRYMAMDSALCSEDCHTQWTRRSAEAPFVRACAQCYLEIRNDESLAWETMDFCNETCLGKYQACLGPHCTNCRKAVLSARLGKFCIRFGHGIKQFCSPACLDEYKKGLKICSYCQKDISSGEDGFLAPVGDKGQFKNFCSQSCMTKYEQIYGNLVAPEEIAECAVCSHKKPVTIEVLVGSKVNKLCSEPCFAAFKFVNNVSEGHCSQCKRYFDKIQSGRVSIYFEDKELSFCCKTCLNIYVLVNRKIIPCGTCKVKKYNFDMIKKTLPHGSIMVCSLTCLSQYQKTTQQQNWQQSVCEGCQSSFTHPFKVTINKEIKLFCSSKCASTFKKSIENDENKDCNNQATSSGLTTPAHANTQSMSTSTEVSYGHTQIFQNIVSRPPCPKECQNKAIFCKPYTHNKGTSCRPMPCYKSTQTDESLTRKCLIPVPVPIFVPAPMHMYSSPFPVPVPFPLPVPVPIFIPTTRNSAKGIFKEIKKIQEKIPTDPFEAELLMMAEMVAGEKKQDPTDSESEDGPENEVAAAESFSPEAVDTSNTFGDDIMQMALKMASELEEPAVDMESVLTSNTITPAATPTVDSKALYAPDPDEAAQALAMARGRRRPMRGGRGGAVPNKRARRSGGLDLPNMAPPEPLQPPRLEVEKPDANMCLKYTFGVNAWRHWVMQKNAELEKAALTNRKIKPFKPDLLQLTADELNFSLCLFVKEVKKPSGQEYAPDTILYLCLGIQQFLFENGRIDNIFTDSYYEKFTDCLDEVAKKFAALYDDSQFVVTRVEEEHLWESKQLGAHSPHVLLNTLMFFNTKHFNLVTVEEHMQLSFSHIMKHWKRNPNSPGVAKVPGSRNVLLRFYPPQSALEANSRKKKVYEQQENEDNPLRCPVKLYEFYLSKCPESVKTRNDVFYLLPERSCVPDSPVWYSTMALGREPLMKMLHRIKMVKEINMAVLSS